LISFLYHPLSRAVAGILGAAVNQRKDADPPSSSQTMTALDNCDTTQAIRPQESEMA
jgi:hypothetical protein